MPSFLRSHALRILLLLFVFSSTVSYAASNQYIAEDVFQKVSAATVMVHIEYGNGNDNQISWGTGFVIGNGLVMTNAHVVRDSTPTRIFIHNKNLPVTEAKVVADRYDRGNNGYYFDVALLSFTPPAGATIPSLPFALNVESYQEVFAFGYPGSEQQRFPPGEAPRASMVVTGGSINQVIEANPPLLMHDALCMNGNSGGPLTNARGEVVGMQTWSADPDYRNIVESFAISSRGLAAFVQSIGYRPQTVG